MSVTELDLAGRRRRAHRVLALSTADKVAAVFKHRALYELADVLPAKSPVGRPAHHPGYLVLAYGVLARLFRSGNAVQTELKSPELWRRICDTVTEASETLPAGLVPPPGSYPPDWNTFRYARDRYLTDSDILTELRARFTDNAVAQAHDLGLLLPDGPGSWSRPHRSRTVYGDGTIIRPMYRHTGDATSRRRDPDAADHHRHDGRIHGQNFVALYARGDDAHQRLVLAVDRVPAPGQEAATAVALTQTLHHVTGTGMQALVYDGALRGTHIDELMSRCGIVVVNKVHASSRTARRRGTDGAPRWLPLGTWTHDTPGNASCAHTLAAVDGAVSEVALDDRGRPIVLHRLDRKQVKRSQRSSGLFHFNVGYEIPCPRGASLAWITPHSEPGDPHHRRADAVRIIAEGEPDFTRLYGLRNDAESFNSALKRTLLVDRAMSLGANRQLLDLVCFGLLHNAVTGHHNAAASSARASRRQHRQAA